MMTYPTDLSDAEYRHIEEHLPTANRRGRPKIHTPREILNAVFYVLKSGCPWRLLPRDFPPWRSVYHLFRAWRIDGTWERLNVALRERLRARSGRNPNPSAGIVDSQTTKTTGVGGQERGFDPAKQVEGRKRLSWWTLRNWCLRRRYTAPGCPTKTASGCFWSRCAIALGALLTCGSMLVTRGGAGDGPRRS